MTARKLVMITGATRGLGREVTDRFWQGGDDLVLIARDKGSLQKVSDFLGRKRRNSQRVHFFSADLSNLTEIFSLIATIRDDVGNPDILINNAAVQGPIGPLYENDWAKWQASINVNLLAPIQLCRGLLPSMIENRYGRIVNISGGGATAPRPNFTCYATAKCGLVRFSETLAQETSRYGITVNCIAPGAMKSRLTDEILNAGEKFAGNSEVETARKLCQENLHTEKRAADLVHFLTTDACSQINGRLISAVWDSWEHLPDHAKDIQNSDIYTLRRILPKERNVIFE